jgi:hypothetical protein
MFPAHMALKDSVLGVLDEDIVDIDAESFVVIFLVGVTK